MFDAHWKTFDAILDLMLIAKHHIVSVRELAILVFLVNFATLHVMFPQIFKLFILIFCGRQPSRFLIFFGSCRTYICICRSIFLLNFLYSFYSIEYIIASLFGFIWDSAMPMFCKREEVFRSRSIQNWGQSILRRWLW